jgi:hypothetical protein
VKLAERFPSLFFVPAQMSTIIQIHANLFLHDGEKFSYAYDNNLIQNENKITFLCRFPILHFRALVSCYLRIALLHGLTFLHALYVNSLQRNIVKNTEMTGHGFFLVKVEY